MTVTTNAFAAGGIGVPEPDLTPADLIARAEAMVPTLVSRQTETEERTYYAPDTHERFAAAGFYRILVPRRYGGYEFGAETFLRVVMTLARGCPSTAWMFCLGAAHALAAGSIFSEQAQAELFRTGEFISPAVIAPAGTGERTPDGWLINGTWNYCSGAPYATHFIGHTFVAQPDGPPKTLLFVVPRDQWRMLDDWGRQLGLKGSGSHSVVIENGRIPDHFAFEGVHLSEIDVTDGTPGRDLHNPEYGGGPLSFMLLESAALAVGMAQGALAAYEELLITRRTMFTEATRVQDPDYQWWYGQASGMIATAEAALINAVQQWHDICERGQDAFTRDKDLRLATICREVIKLAWRAVESYLFPTGGSRSVRSGERVERVWRDMSTLHSHVGIGVLLAGVATREYTKVHFDVH